MEDEAREPQEPLADWRATEEEITRRWNKVVKYLIAFAVFIIILGFLGGGFLLIAEILAFGLILAIAVIAMVYLFIRPARPPPPPRQPS